MPHAFVEHQLSGRIRLRIPSKRGDRQFFEDARQKLSGTAIDSVSANPDTGSLLIRYTGDLGALQAEAARRGIFQMQAGKPAEAASKSPRAAGSPPVSSAELGLSGLGLYQILRGRTVGSASESFWNAYGAYRMLDNPSLALLLCGLGLWQSLRGEWLGSASALFFYAFVARKLSAEGQAAPAPESGDPGAASSRRRGAPQSA